MNHGSKGYLINQDGIQEDVIFWFAHPYGVIDFYTRDAKYIYLIDEKLCIRDTRKPQYFFSMNGGTLEVDEDSLTVTVLDELEVIDYIMIDLWED